MTQSDPLPADLAAAHAMILATAMPLVDAIHAHVFAAERLHADDTTVPVLAKEKTRTGRLWAYVRDDRPFAAGGQRSSTRLIVAGPIPSGTWPRSRA